MQRPRSLLTMSVLMLECAKTVSIPSSIRLILQMRSLTSHQMSVLTRISCNLKLGFVCYYLSSSAFSLPYSKSSELVVPTFQLNLHRDPEKPPSSNQLADASKIRKRLMDSFAQYDFAARRIRDLPTTSDTQKKLQKAIYQQATNFLHLHMLPLKTLPKVLKHASPHGAYSNGHLTPNGRPNSGALASIKLNDIDNVSQVSSSSAISALEEEEKSLRDRLIVLEEQKFFVGQMVADANKRRKFDEVSSLSQNVQDLSKEIDQIQGQISQLDFAGAYGGQGVETPPAR